MEHRRTSMGEDISMEALRNIGKYKVHIRPPIPVVPNKVEGDQESRERDGDPVPRSLIIQKRDLINYGYTPGCPGCLASANYRRYRPHTVNCRQRVDAAMFGDDMGTNRVKEARAREDAYLEHKVKTADQIARPEMHQDQPQRVVNQADPMEEAITAAKPAVVGTTDDAMTWEQALAENNFHDVVNEDSDMYAEIENLPDYDSMVAQIIAIVSKNHVSEVWSPPRVTKLASEYGVSPC